MTALPQPQPTQHGFQVSPDSPFEQADFDMALRAVQDGFISRQVLLQRLRQGESLRDALDNSLKQRAISDIQTIPGRLQEFPLKAVELAQFARENPLEFAKDAAVAVALGIPLEAYNIFKNVGRAAGGQPIEQPITQGFSGVFTLLPAMRLGGALGLQASRLAGRGGVAGAVGQVGRGAAAVGGLVPPGAATAGGVATDILQGIDEPMEIFLGIAGDVVIGTAADFAYEFANRSIEEKQRRIDEGTDTPLEEATVTPDAETLTRLRTPSEQLNAVFQGLRQIVSEREGEEPRFAQSVRTVEQNLRTAFMNGKLSETRAVQVFNTISQMAQERDNRAARGEPRRTIDARRAVNRQEVANQVIALQTLAGTAEAAFNEGRVDFNMGPDLRSLAEQAPQLYQAGRLHAAVLPDTIAAAEHYLNVGVPTVVEGEVAGPPRQPLPTPEGVPVPQATGVIPEQTSASAIPLPGEGTDLPITPDVPLGPPPPPAPEGADAPVSPTGTPGGRAEEAVPAETVPEEPDISPSPIVGLMLDVQPFISGGQDITRRFLRERAQIRFGPNRNARDEFDALEGAINMHIQLRQEEAPFSLNPRVSLDMATVNAEELGRIELRLPTQTTRDEGQVRAQQFSTPPNYAYAVAWLGNLQETDQVLEPSAGTGSIAVFPHGANVETHVNEIPTIGVGGPENRRVEILRALFPAERVHTIDALHVNSTALPANVQPTVVLMNPPFSANVQREGQRDPHLQGRHVLEAFKRLQQGGRLVAIVGGGQRATGGMALEAPTQRQFWEDITEAGGNVRANIRVAGKVYKKFGTSFATRVLVIDKAGEAGTRNTLTGNADSVPELMEQLEGIRNDRPTIGGVTDGTAAEGTPATEQQPSEPPGETVSGTGGARPTTGPAIQPPVDTVAGEPGELPTGPADRGPTPGEVGPSPAGEPGGGEPVPTGRGGAGRGGVREPDSGTRGGGTAGTAPPAPSGERAGLPGEVPASGPVGTNKSRADELGDAIKDDLDELFRALDGRQNMLGIDPESFQIAVRMVGRLIELGAVKFVDVVATVFNKAKARIDDLKPYMRSAYDAAFHLVSPETQAQMDDRETVSNFDLDDVATRIQDGTYFDPQTEQDNPPPPSPTPNPTVEGEQLQPATRSEVTQQERTEFGPFTAWRPTAIFPGAQPHPTPLVESSAMGAVPLPEINYTPNLPQSIINDGSVSEAQLEGIALAGQAHEEILPSGHRRGFFDGDGTGAGKGRTIAGIMIDNWRQGRKKAIWVSNSWALYHAARQDFVDLGFDPTLVFPHSKGAKITQANDPLLDSHGKAIFYGANGRQAIPVSEGIMFTTYDTLRSTSGGNRLEQIEKWLGDDFDGAIVFDESHMMKNAKDKELPNGQVVPASKTARMGIRLQNNKKNARVSYFSATGATELENYQYATRLGLWGEGTQFENDRDFVSSLRQGGVAAMEAVASVMKGRGMYVSRSISFEGVTYDTLRHSLSPEQDDTYNFATQVWRGILESMQQTASANGMTQGQIRDLNSQFWGGHQRYFEGLLTSFQMPSVIADAQAELDKGNSVIIQLTNTNESAMERAVAAQMAQPGATIENLDISGKQNVIDYVLAHYPVNQYETVDIPDGQGGFTTVTRVATRPAPTEADPNNREPIVNLEAVRRRDALVAEIDRRLNVPLGALDALLNHTWRDADGRAKLGLDMVAEVTGRSQRYVFAEDPLTGEINRIQQNRNSQADGVREGNEFMDGERRVLVISKAGFTGRSFHASSEAKNQQKRIHYVLQPGWQADLALQGMGRSHRSGQVEPPEYRLVQTNLKAQGRFIATIARRLEQLGALTRGSRETTTGGLFSAEHNLENEYGKAAVRRFFSDVQDGNLQIMNPDGRPDTPQNIAATIDAHMLFELYDPETGEFRDSVANNIEVKQFLNRLLNVETPYQNQFFDAFFQRLQQALTAAKANNTYDQGVERIEGEDIQVVETRRIQTSSPYPTEYARLTVEAVQERLAFGDLQGQIALAAAMEGNERFEGFFDDGEQIYGVIYWRSSTDTQGRRHNHYTRVYPVGGIRPSSILASHAEEMLTRNAERLDPSLEDRAIEQRWNTALETMPRTKTVTRHLITGDILAVWKLMDERAPQIRRATLAGGQRQLLGRELSRRDFERQLGDLTRSASFALTPQEAWAAVIDEGNHVVLRDNNMALVRRRVQGENRIEIEGSTFMYGQSLGSRGVFNEIINGSTRYFIPDMETLDNILRWNPPIRVDQPQQKTTDDPPPDQEPNVEPVEAQSAPDPSTLPQWLTNEVQRHQGGLAVFWDGEVGLVRGFNVGGDHVYVPITANAVANRDIEVLTANHFERLGIAPERAESLKEIAKSWKAQEVAQAAAHPEGPFAEDALWTGRVTRSESVPENLAQYTADMLEQFGYDGNIFLFNTDEFESIGVQSAAANYGLYGDFKSPTSSMNWRPHGGTRRLPQGGHYLGLRLNELTDPNLLMETLTHEIGHIIQKEIHDQAPTHIQAEIASAYRQWRRERIDRAGQTVEGVIRETRPPVFAEAMVAGQTGPIDVPLDAPVGQMGNVQDFASFDEFFADQTVRWAFESDVPRNAVDRFFKRVADALRALYRAFSERIGRPLTEPTMRRYLDEWASVGQSNPPSTPSAPTRVERQVIRQEAEGGVRPEQRVTPERRVAWNRVLEHGRFFTDNATYWTNGEAWVYRAPTEAMMNSREYRNFVEVAGGIPEMNEAGLETVRNLIDASERIPLTQAAFAQIGGSRRPLHDVVVLMTPTGEPVALRRDYAKVFWNISPDVEFLGSADQNQIVAHLNGEDIGVVMKIAIRHDATRDQLIAAAAGGFPAQAMENRIRQGAAAQGEPVKRRGPRDLYQWVRARYGEFWRSPLAAELIQSSAVTLDKIGMSEIADSIFNARDDSELHGGYAQARLNDAEKAVETALKGLMDKMVSNGRAKNRTEARSLINENLADVVEKKAQPIDPAVIPVIKTYRDLQGRLADRVIRYNHVAKQYGRLGVVSDEAAKAAQNGDLDALRPELEAAIGRTLGEGARFSQVQKQALLKRGAIARVVDGRQKWVIMTEDGAHRVFNERQIRQPIWIYEQDGETIWQEWNPYIGDRYYPHMIDWRKLNPDATPGSKAWKRWNDYVDQFAEANDVTSEEAWRILEETRDSLRVRRYGNLELRRKYNFPGYDKDFFAVTQSYFYTAHRRLSHIEAFGQNNERLIEAMNRALLPQIDDRDPPEVKNRKQLRRSIIKLRHAVGYRDGEADMQLFLDASPNPTNANLFYDERGKPIVMERDDPQFAEMTFIDWKTLVDAGVVDTARPESGRIYTAKNRGLLERPFGADRETARRFEMAREIVMAQLGHTPYSLYDSELSDSFRTMRNLNAWAFLSRAWTQNVAQGANTTKWIGAENYAKGLRENFTSKEAQRWAVSIGATISDLTRWYAGGGFHADTLLRKFTPFEKVEQRVNRMTAAIGGRHYIAQAIKDLIENPNDKTAMLRFTELRIREPQVTEALGGGPYTAADVDVAANTPFQELDTRLQPLGRLISQGAKRVVEQTQFRLEPIDLPLLYSRSPIGRLITQFTTFTNKQSQFAKRAFGRDVRRIVKGEGPGRLVGLGGLASATAATIGFGAVATVLFRIASGMLPDDDDMNWVNMMNRTAALGIVSHVWETRNVPGAISTFFGLRTLSALETAIRRPEAIPRFVPVVGRPLQNIVESLRPEEEAETVGRPTRSRIARPTRQ